MFSRNKKHEQVRALILQRHLGLAIGSPIPPEIQLAREFDVSRVTVARAINDLVRQGIALASSRQRHFCG
ncbi:MAG: GntR family transcriptional regulator [Planctomycetota bacterium]|nr:GntR family transcriptional regulator [Planctomycetota bacterium]